MNNLPYAAIELGGTKTICSVGNGTGTITDQLRISTAAPETTLLKVSAFLEQYQPFAGIGIGAFGPVVVDRLSDNYGTVQVTPKKNWQGVSLVNYFKQKFNCFVNLDTDVNAAALAEYYWGGAKGLRNFIYITVGTGIGAGVIIDGKPLQGLCHPEVGHLALPRAYGDENYKSSCEYHPHCAEGLASGTAILKRWGQPLNKWSSNHPSWEYQAEYLAELSHTLTLLISPQKIIFGGGVSNEILLEKVRRKLHKKLNGYVFSLVCEKSLNAYLTLPMLGDQAGPTGAFLLAMGGSPLVNIDQVVQLNKSEISGGMTS